MPESAHDMQKYKITDLKICKCKNRKFYDQSTDIRVFFEDPEYQSYDYCLNAYFDAPKPQKIKHFGVEAICAGDIFTSYQSRINAVVDEIIKKYIKSVKKLQDKINNPDTLPIEKKICEEGIRDQQKFIEPTNLMDQIFVEYKWYMGMMTIALESEETERLFQIKLTDYLKRNPEFISCNDIKMYKDVPGLYMLVLDRLNKAYIGQAKDIKTRIQRHWNQKDWRTGGIDTFGALDTTRIFIIPTNNETDMDSLEFEKITSFDPQFLLNKMQGGKLCVSGLDHFQERERLKKIMNLMSKDHLYVFEPGYESFKENYSVLFE